MTYDLTKKILDLDGKEIVDPPAPAKDGEVLTYARVCIRSLMHSDRDTDGERKLKRFLLAQKIHQNPSVVQLSAEEITLVLSCAEQTYSVAVYGPLHLELNQDAG